MISLYNKDAMNKIDETFKCMGTDVRIIVEDKIHTQRALREKIKKEKRFLLNFDKQLSRFNPESELSKLNSNPAKTILISPLMADLLFTSLHAAKQTNGLVNPTMVKQIETSGYKTSMLNIKPASLIDALNVLHEIKPASANDNDEWKFISIASTGQSIFRPINIQFDSGSFGKGLAADLVVNHLNSLERVMVDCGGDIRVKSIPADAEIYEIMIEHPLTHELVYSIKLYAGGVATSGINRRIWQTSDGEYHHHLLNPATGQSAWTGIISATAIAETTVAAETLSKQVFLSGAKIGKEILANNMGGVIFLEDGTSEFIAPIS